MAAAEDADPEQLIASPALGELGRMKYWDPESVEQRAKGLIERLTREVGAK